MGTENTLTGGSPVERVVSLRDPEPAAWLILTPSGEVTSVSTSHACAESAIAGKEDWEIMPLYRRDDHRLLRDAIDADKYRFLEPRFFAADFEYGSGKETVLIFRWPENAAVGACMTENIERARLAEMFAKKQANA